MSTSAGEGDTAALDAVVAQLRAAGARFAFLHGSRATGTARPESDTDVAAWFGPGAPSSFDVLLPAGVDLTVLDTAPLELAGRIAATGVVLFSDDEPARVHWQAATRTVWFDERPRFERAHREFLEAAVLRGR